MVSKVSKPFSLLNPATPGQYGPREGRIATSSDWWMLPQIEGPVVIDFETTGLDMIDPDFRVVGIGLAGKGLENGIYYSLKNGENPTDLLKWICKQELIAHNVVYDSAVLERLVRDHNLPTTLSKDWPWKWDTMSMYHHLSQDEWLGQSKGLKAAQVDILGWEDKGDIELDAWLASQGLGKGDMWQAPDEILGKYGCYDVQSTYQLYQHLLPQLQKFPDAVEFISEIEVPYHYRSIVEMRFYGIKMDLQKLCLLQGDLKTNIEAFNSDFITDIDVAKWATSVDILKLKELNEQEPPKLTKTGKVTKRWEKWEEKITNYEPAHWLNTNSKAQLRDLFFNHLYEVSEVRPVKGFDGNQKEFKGGKLLWEVDIFVEDTKITHEWAAKTSDIPVSKELLPKLGEVGQMLYDYNKDVKLLGYVKGMIESLKDGIHHGQLRPLGTSTGRCSGSGGINLQQISKDPRYLECFTARKGHTLIDADVTALEPCVLAELSGCPNYMKLYGPDAKPNDIYLFVGANTQALGSTLRRYGYNPDSPTPEAISETKKKLKKERGIAKVLHLSSGYGAGAGKIWKTLLSQGIELSFADAKQIHADYWELFKRVKEYERELLSERENNGGWIIDGLGLPVTIGKHKVKDILNSLIQGTGHRIMVRHIANIMKLRDKYETRFNFWISDFHDETITECPDEDVEEVLSVFNEAEKLTNKELDGIIYLEIEPETGSDLRPFKL